MAEDLFRPQLGEPHHVAYVVDDIEATMSGLVGQLGAGPFFLVGNVQLENVLSAVSRRNWSTTRPSATAAEGDRVDGDLSPAPERVQKGFAGPRPGIQHLAYVLSPTEGAEVRRSLDERGLTELSTMSSAERKRRSTTPPPRSATTSRSMWTFEGLRDFFEMMRAAPGDGTARNRCARSRADRRLGQQQALGAAVCAVAATRCAGRA